MTNGPSSTVTSPASQTAFKISDMLNPFPYTAKTAAQLVCLSWIHLFHPETNAIKDSVRDIKSLVICINKLRGFLRSYPERANAYPVKQGSSDQRNIPKPGSKYMLSGDGTKGHVQLSITETAGHAWQGDLCIGTATTTGHISDSTAWRSRPQDH